MAIGIPNCNHVSSTVGGVALAGALARFRRFNHLNQRNYFTSYYKWVAQVDEPRASISRTMVYVLATALSYTVVPHTQPPRPSLS